MDILLRSPSMNYPSVNIMERITIDRLTDRSRTVHRHQRRTEDHTDKDGIPHSLSDDEHHGKIHSRKDISRFAWGSENLNHPRTIDTHISNIRKKIGRINEREIITVIKGVGTNWMIPLRHNEYSTCHSLDHLVTIP